LIASIISIVIVGGLSAIGSELKTIFASLVF